MPGRYEIAGDGTPDSPMVVTSDETASDGEASPQPRNNDREPSQGSDIYGAEQDTPKASAGNQVTGMTGNQPVAVFPLPPTSTTPIVPAPAPMAPSPGAPNGPGVHAAQALFARGGAITAGLPSSMRSAGAVVPPGVNQALRSNCETLTPDATDPTKITARFRVEIPGRPGQYYDQTDTIPMLNTTAVSPTDPHFFFIPDLTLSKLPKKIRKSKVNAHQPNVWVRQGTSNTWVRKNPQGGADQVFKLVVMLRRFNKTTDKYEEMYLNLKMLMDPNPNEKTWMYAYNKWIDQIRRRRDDNYTQTTHKDHWSVVERRELCEAINAYIRKSGLKRFGSGADVQIPQSDMQVMADAVNTAGDRNRKADAVRGQIFSSHVKKNKAIFDVVELAKSVRARVRAGEVLSQEERYPMNAIPRSAFPKDLTPSRKRAFAGRGSLPKRRAPAGSRSPSPTGDVPLPACMSEFLNDGGAPGMKSRKRVKFATDSGEELPSDDQWSETDEEILSERAELARDNDVWSDTDDEDDTEQRERQNAEALQFGIHQSLLRQSTPVSTGIAVPGDEHSDSDSGSEEGPAAPASSGRHTHRAQSPSPPQKRKRNQDDKNDAGEGYVSDMGAAQERSVKKARTKPHN